MAGPGAKELTLSVGSLFFSNLFFQLFGAVTVDLGHSRPRPSTPEGRIRSAWRRESCVAGTGFLTYFCISILFVMHIRH